MAKIKTNVAKAKEQINKIKKLQKSLTDYPVPQTSTYNGLVFQEAAEMLNPIIEHLKNIE